MPNPFDQFDAPARANPFDQFDGGTATAVAEAPDPRRAAKGRALRGELMAERRSGYGADALMAGAGGAEFVVDAASKMITSFPRAAYAVSEMITPTGQPFVDRPTIEKWTPEMAATVRRAIGGPGSTDISGDETAAGVANAVSDFGEFFTTPEGVATLGAGAAPALARAALGAGFAGQMSSHVPEAFAQAGELSAGDDRAEAVRFGLGALGTAVFAGAIPIGAIAHQSTPRVLPPAERAGKMLEAAVNDPALLDRFEQVANELALERSAPESAQRGVVSGQRPAPAGLFTAEDFNPFDRFDKPPSPPETLPPEAAPASQPSTSPLSTSPALRGEAAMETRPTAEMGLDRTQPSTLNPELSTDLADTIAALRAGYRPELEKTAAAGVMPAKSAELQALLREAGMVKGTGISGEGIRLVSAVAKEKEIPDWPNTRDVADYDALIAGVRERLAAPAPEARGEVEKLPEPVAAPFPPYAEKLGIKSWQQAKKLGLDTIITDAPEMAREVVRAASNWIYASPERAAEYIAGEIVAKTRLMGGRDTALRSLANDYYQKAKGATEPGQQQRFNATAQALEALRAKPVEPPPAPSAATPSTLNPPLSTAEVSEFNALEQQRRAGSLDAPAAARYRELEVRAGQGDFLAPPPKPLTKANVPTAAKVTPAQAKSAANPKFDFNPRVAKEQKKFLLNAVDQALAAAPDTSKAEIQELWRASEHYAAQQKLEDYTKANPYPDLPQRNNFEYTDAGLAKFKEAEAAWEVARTDWEQRRNTELAALAEPYLQEMIGGADVNAALTEGTSLAFYRSLPHVTIEVPGDGTFSIVNNKDAIRDFKERAAKFPTTAGRAKAPGSPRVNPTPVPALGEPTKENVLKAASLALSTDDSRFVLQSVWSDGKQTVATDGRRMLIFDKGVGGTEKNPVMLDAKGKPAVVDREYPNWKQVRPAEADLTKIFSGQDAAKLWTILKQADAILDKEAGISKSVKLWWNPDRTLGVSSSGPDVGSYEHNVQPNAKLVTALKPEFLMDALDAARKTGSEKVDVHWVDELSPVVIRGDHVDAIIMPMRLTGPGPSSFEPTLLNKYDLAKTPAEARAMMEKDLKALEDLRTPTGSDAAKADWLREQLLSVEDIGAEIIRVEAKRKKEAAKPRKTNLQKLDQEATDRQLQDRIDALKSKQREAARKAEFDEAEQIRKATEGSPDINTGSLGESGMGGAKPGEFAGNSGTPTGIKNATVDAERARRGLPPAMESARRDWGSVWDEAMARIDTDPAVQDRLIAELKAKPRALTDTEDALLLHRQIDLQNEYGRATRELAVAYEDSRAFPNRLADVEALKARTAEVSDQLLELYNVNKAAGTETGRGLAARKMMANEDYTLAAMEMEKRAALGGAPLTDAERSAMGKLHERIVELEAKAVAREEQVATERASRMTDEAIADMKRELASKPSYSPQLIKIAEEILGKLKVQANKSRDHFKGRVLSLSPEDIYHLGVIGAEKIARTGLDVTKFGLEMAAEFGDGITPYIKAVWDRANLHLDNEGAKYGDKSEPVKRLLRKRDAAGQREGVIEGLKKAQAEGLPVELLGDYVRKLALSFVRAGVAERNALVDAVHKVLTEDIGMELSRRETMDAISGYGRFKPLDADAAKAQLRDLKGQMQQVAKLEDITAKKPLQKTGVERRSQSDEERRLIQQVNEAKRRHGVVVTDPARQLKSALAARTTALKHRKADLEYQIATRERIVKTKTPTPFDAETKLLEVEVENLTRQLDELVPRPGITDGQRSALAERSVEREIAVLEEQIKTGDVKARTARPIMSTAKLESLKARREALRAERQELRELDGEFQRQQAEKSLAQQKASLEAGIAAREKALAEGPKPPVGREVSRPADPALESLMQKRDALNRQLAEARKPKGTPEERALKALHTRLTTSAAEYAARLARGDFAPRVRKPVPTDPTTLRLKAEAERAKVEWREGLERDRFRNLSPTKKAIEHAKEVLNLPRAVLASWDFSAVLRQGGFITLNPRNWRRAASGLAPMFRALASETRAHMVEKSIRDRPNAPLYDRAKLYLASLDTSKLTAMEELFMSRMSRAIPGVRASERAYITFLNKLRADSFDAMVDRMQAKGTPLTDLELQAVGNFVNVSTGRGDMGARAAAADTLATIFFSPRLVVSRFQLLTGQPLRKAGTLRVARAVAAEYAGFLSGLAVVYALANMAGAEVETDPRSSDFGKLRFGNTRVDPLAGLAQVTGLLSRLGTGETKSISGKVKPIVGDLPYGADTAPDVIFRFLRTKLSPVVGAAVDLRQGENVVGEKVSPTTTLQRMAVPLSFQEIYKVMLEDGVAKGTALGILSLFGWGLQQFDDRKPKK